MREIFQCVLVGTRGEKGRRCGFNYKADGIRKSFYHSLEYPHGQVEIWFINLTRCRDKRVQRELPALVFEVWHA